jgi:hypothetical protein
VAARRIATLFQGSPERLRRPRAVRVLGLPPVSQLGDGLRLAVGHENRIEPESLRTPRLGGDEPLQDPGAANLFSLRRDGDELTHIAGPPTPALDSLELGKQALDVLAGRESRRLDSRPAAESFDLEP